MKAYISQQPYLGVTDGTTLDLGANGGCETDSCPMDKTTLTRRRLSQVKQEKEL